MDPRLDKVILQRRLTVGYKNVILADTTGDNSNDHMF